MEKDLEQRWQKAVMAKETGALEWEGCPESGIPKGYELLFKVTDPDYKATVHENWNQRCLAALRKERREAEKRYNVRIGQTEVYCARCGRPCWPGNHTCREVLLEKANKVRKTSSKKTPELIAILKRFDPKMAAIMLEVPTKYVSQWIYRESVPDKYHKSVSELAKPRQRYAISQIEENAP